MSPFGADIEVKLAAERARLYSYTRPIIAIDDAMLPAGYRCIAPNYRKIRRDLRAGIEIPGARMTTDVEYILTPKGDSDGQEN